ncbi:MAG TPA: serine/threonine-protein kinase [Polyangia bacterium]
MLDSMIGRAIGNYIVQSKVGDGGMGVVYVAAHPRLGRQVAIKVLHPGSEEHPERVARFFNEARAAHEIKNQHIVEILDFGDLPEGRPYLTMEWLDGRSLSTVVANGRPVPWRRAFHIISGIAEALGGAHAAGIIHRDLKPDNIFLVTRGDDPDFVKVLDFGIAKMIQGLANESMKTATGQIMGTPAYMAPEQCRGDATIDHRADLYSLAVIAYELVSGRLPFTAEGCGSLLVKHILDPPPPIRGEIPEFPAELDAVILRALEKAPDARYAGVQDFVSALAAASADHAQTLDRPRPPHPNASTRPLSDELHLPDEAVSPEPESKDLTSLATLGDTAVEIPYERRLGKPLLFGALAVAAAAGVFFLLHSRGEPHPSPAPAPVAALPVPVPPVTPPTLVPPIHVRIAAEPHEATLALDGQPVPNPFTLDPTPQSSEHTLTIKAEGRREETRTVVFDRDVDLNIVMLDPEPVAAAPAARPEKRHSGEQPGHRGPRAHTAEIAPTTARAKPVPTGLALRPAPTPAAATTPEKSVYRGTRLPLDSEY